LSLSGCLSAEEARELRQTAAVYSAGVWRQLEQTDQPIGMADSLIAGIALAQDATLYTRKRKHFERYPASGCSKNNLLLCL